MELTESDTIHSSMMSWCQTNKHQSCKREYRRFLIDNKTNKVIWLDEVVRCSCKKRGCLCYTKPADRPKETVKKTRRKK